MLDLFAITNRGIEAICAQEMASILGAHVTQIAYRRVHAAFSGNIQDLLTLRTVDDLFITLAEWHGIHRDRTQLAAFEQLALELKVWQAANVRTAIDSLSDVPAFSVTANFVGRRNYSAEEIKLALAKGVEAISGWRYAQDDRQCDINLRVFIDHDIALVGMRLAKTPLYRRAYKQDHLPGSLKPSVAAALVRLARGEPGHTLLDPCCGAGTILIEATFQDALAIGGDQDLAAVAAAQDNAAAAAATITVQNWDARSLPIADASVERVVSNLPWGRQVEVDSALADFYAAACAEMERVLVRDGRVVLLTNHTHLVTFSTLAIEQSIEISLFGQQPTILVFGCDSPTVADSP